MTDRSDEELYRDPITQELEAAKQRIAELTAELGDMKERFQLLCDERGLAFAMVASERDAARAELEQLRGRVESEAAALLREFDDAAVSVEWRSDEGNQWRQRYESWKCKDGLTRCASAEFDDWAPLPAARIPCELDGVPDMALDQELAEPAKGEP